MEELHLHFTQIRHISEWIASTKSKSEYFGLWHSDKWINRFDRQRNIDSHFQYVNNNKVNEVKFVLECDFCFPCDSYSGQSLWIIHYLFPTCIEVSHYTMARQGFNKSLFRFLDNGRSKNVSNSNLFLFRIPTDHFSVCIPISHVIF